MKYLICYFYYKSDGSFGFSNITVTTDENEDIFTEKQISEIQKQLEQAYKFDGVAIQNIIKLNG